MSRWICITAKDEGATIGPIVHKLKCRGLHVVVIDDGSEDHTALRAVNAGAIVRWHETSQGIGPSLMEAWQVALDYEAAQIVQMDAGGSHDPSDIWRLLLGLRNYDLMLGSRFCEGAKYEGRAWRAWMSRLAAQACNMHAGQHITDWTSGYRAMRAETAETLLEHDYEATMHGWQIEVLGTALANGLNISEAPIRYRAGDSSFDISVAREAFDVWRTL